MTQENQPVIRIGELLVQSGVITAYDLSEAEKLSSHMKVQFGRLLIMAGCLTEEALECALEAQSLIRDGLLNAEIACEALAFAVQENIPLRQALEMLDCLPQFGTSTLRLAELIHDANIIEEEKLHDAFDTSMETNRPLPEVLVEMQCISPGLLSIMLRMQEQIRNDTLDREDSINELKGTFKIWKRADKAMANDPMSKSAIIGAASTAPPKPSRYTSSFDSVTRLPAMSPEILAGLSANEAASAQAVPSTTTAASGASPAPTSAGLVPQSLATSPQALQQQPFPQQPGAQQQQASSPPAQSVPQTPAHIGSHSAGLHPGASGTGTGGGGGGATTGAPTRSGGRGGDDLNVDWIMQDYANAPAGQPMPDGVILYSQGYFPPDEKKPSEESFADGFSDEDEERINALLDVFASDVSTTPSATLPVDSRTSGAEISAADSWLIAADGWGVPDLAAAGANLTGAEMFAKAQADLSSSGWSYSQGAAGQSNSSSGQAPLNAPSGRTSEQMRSQPMAPPVPPTSPPPSPPSSPPPPPPPPAVPPGPLGQPLYVTPTPPLPTKGLGHPDFRQGDGVRPPMSPFARRSEQPLEPSVSETNATSSPSTLPSTSPSSSSTSQSTSSAAPQVVDAASAITASPSAPQLDGIAEESFFSSKLKESISDAISENPFKFRRTGSQSTPEVPAVDDRHKLEEESPALDQPSADDAAQAAQVNDEVMGRSDSSEQSDAPETSGASEELAQEKMDDQQGQVESGFNSASDHREGDSGENIAKSDAEEAKLKSESEPGAAEAAEAAEARKSLESEHGGHDDSQTEPSLAESGPTDTSESSAQAEAKSIERDFEHGSDQTDGHAVGSGTADAHSDSSAPESKDKSDKESPSAQSDDKVSLQLNLSSKRKSEQEDKSSSDLVSMLEAAQFFSYDELERAILKGLKDQTIAAELLGVLGIIDKSSLDAAVRIQKLVKSGSVDASKAITSLDDLRTHKIRPAEVTEQLGIKKTKRRK